jgi:hypothetical protein
MSAAHTAGMLVVSGSSLVTSDDKFCIATIEDDGGYEAPAEQREANARRLAHCWNTHDDLIATCRAALARLEALDAERSEAGRLLREMIDKETP